jgi:hypothetical protein
VIAPLVHGKHPRTRAGGDRGDGGKVLCKGSFHKDRTTGWQERLDHFGMSGGRCRHHIAVGKGQVVDAVVNADRTALARSPSAGLKAGNDPYLSPQRAQVAQDEPPPCPSIHQADAHHAAAR